MCMIYMQLLHCSVIQIDDLFKFSGINMAIVFDIVHIADVNFFKNAIRALQKNDQEIIIIMRERGGLRRILEKELNISPIIIGRHYHGVLLKGIWGIKRVMDLIRFLKSVDVDVVVGFGSFYIAQAAQIISKPSVIFYDDIEYPLVYYPSKYSSSKFIIPSFINDSGKNVIKFDGFKELAYLHPRYFSPDEDLIKKYDLKADNYVFLRTVGAVSLNVKNHSLPLNNLLECLKDYDLKIILSLEDKSLIEKIDRTSVIILEEPIDDIHSLIGYAALLISSGDTMAREGCLVGTPSIYIGGRNMKVNTELINNKYMFQCSSKHEIVSTINEILKSSMKNEMRREVENRINNHWSDVTEIIIENILETTENTTSK